MQITGSQGSVMLEGPVGQQTGGGCEHTQFSFSPLLSHISTILLLVSLWHPQPILLLHSFSSFVSLSPSLFHSLSSLCCCPSSQRALRPHIFPRTGDGSGCGGGVTSADIKVDLRLHIQGVLRIFNIDFYKKIR